MLTMVKNGSENNYTVVSSFLDITLAGVGYTPSDAASSLATNIISEIYCEFMVHTGEIFFCENIIKDRFAHIKARYGYDIHAHILKDDIEDLNDFDEWEYKSEKDVDTIFDIIKSGRTISEIHFGKHNKFAKNEEDKYANAIYAGYVIDFPSDGSGCYNKMLGHSYDIVIRDSAGIDVERTADSYDELHAYVENGIMEYLLDKYTDKGTSRVK